MNDLPSPAEQFPAGTLLFRGTNVLGSVPVHVKGINNELFLPLQRLRIKPAVDHTPQPLDLRPVPAHDERRCLGKPGKAFRITPADSGVSINGAATAAALCPRRILQPLVRGNRTGTQKNTGSKRRRYFYCFFRGVASLCLLAWLLPQRQVHELYHAASRAVGVGICRRGGDLLRHSPVHRVGVPGLCAGGVRAAQRAVEEG